MHLRRSANGMTLQGRLSYSHNSSMSDTVATAGTKRGHNGC